MALFAALLIAVCYDFPEVKLAEVLDNWASFRRFCGFEVVPSGPPLVRGEPQATAHALSERSWPCRASCLRIDKPAGGHSR
jgi:IS5 family transposase